MWLAVLLTVLASTGNNVGKALQKQATRVLPRFSLDPKIVQQYLRSRQWLLGLAADLGGALLMIAAFSLAPVRLTLIATLRTAHAVHLHSCHGPARSATRTQARTLE